MSLHAVPHIKKLQCAKVVDGAALSHCILSQICKPALECIYAGRRNNIFVKVVPEDNKTKQRSAKHRRRIRTNRIEQLILVKSVISS